MHIYIRLYLFSSKYNVTKRQPQFNYDIIVRLFFKYGKIGTKFVFFEVSYLYLCLTLLYKFEPQGGNNFRGNFIII